MIFAAEILDVSVRQPARDVAGPVDAFARVERVVGELLGSQGRIVEITARQTDAGQAEFTRFADRRRSIVRDDVEAGVVDRAADGDAFEGGRPWGSRNRSHPPWLRLGRRGSSIGPWSCRRGVD